jgi:hypothetical protein
MIHESPAATVDITILVFNFPLPSPPTRRDFIKGERIILTSPKDFYEHK